MLFRGLPRSLILSTGGETKGNENHKPIFILHNTYMIYIVTGLKMQH